MGKPVARILELMAGCLGFNISGEEKRGLMEWETKKSSPFRSLIGTVLSQRTRDENTALASERLFAKYGSAAKLSMAPLREIEGLIRPVGFYRIKAKKNKANKQDNC